MSGNHRSLRQVLDELETRIARASPEVHDNADSFERAQALAQSARTITESWILEALIRAQDAWQHDDHSGAARNVKETIARRILNGEGA